MVIFVRSNQISYSLVASHMDSKADNIFNDAFVHYERLLYPHEHHVFFLHTVHGLEVADVSVYERKQMLGGGGEIQILFCSLFPVAPAYTAVKFNCNFIKPS